MEIFCEILIKQKKTKELFEFINQNNIDFYSVNSNTLINFAELLSSHPTDKQHTQYANLASRALSIALSGKVEESQIIKAAINLKRIGQPEDVIKFVSDAIFQYPSLIHNSVLLQKRATANISKNQ